MTWELETSYEEVTTDELLDDDVITHSFSKLLGWMPVMTGSAEACVGWLVEGDADSREDYVVGSILRGDGTKKKANLTTTGSNNKYRVTKLKAAKGRWNDTCKRCGKGTFVLFSSVEHDGPCKPLAITIAIN